MKPLPTTLAYGLFRWEVTSRRPDHFRAVRRLSLRTADADTKGLAALGLLLYLGFSGLAMAAGFDLAGKLARWAGGGRLSVRESLLQAALVLAWVVLTDALWPRHQVWEARPGWLRFGRRLWRREDLRGLRFRTRQWHAQGIGPNAFFADSPAVGTWLEIVVVLKDGRAQIAWRHSHRLQTRARAWAEEMARVAGVPVLTAKRRREDDET